MYTITINLKGITMKVYFEDGTLSNPPEDKGNVLTIDAGNGPTYCFELLSMAKSSNASVYTNFVNALDVKYSWNHKTSHSDIYFRRNGKWVEAQRCTDRQLKSSLNFLKLYVGGEFD